MSRTLTALAAATLVTLGVAAPASASASVDAQAPYYCNERGTWAEESWIPVYNVPGTWSAACVLDRGAQSNAVRALQDSLNYCYGQGLAVDGEFGARTEAALREVQKIIGVPA
ncbi:peptidoglycan-binding domain-containing protein, partial [Saccharothrix coeruleofusca]